MSGKIIYDCNLDNKQIGVLCILTRRNKKIVCDKELEMFNKLYPDVEINCFRCPSCNKKSQLNYLLYNIYSKHLYKEKDFGCPRTYCRKCILEFGISSKKTKACINCNEHHYRAKHDICNKCSKIKRMEDKISFLQNKINELKNSK